MSAQILLRRLRWPPARFIRIGGIVAAIGFASVALAQSPGHLWASYAVAAFGMGWIYPSVSALAANAVAPHEQGAAAGSVAAAQGLGIVIGPLAGTAIYAVSATIPYLLLGLLLPAATLWASWPATRNAATVPDSA